MIPATKRFSYILQTPDGISGQFNKVRLADCRGEVKRTDIKSLKLFE